MKIDIIDTNYEYEDCKYRLIEAIDNNRLIIIDYINYIDCLPMIDFHRLGTPGIYKRINIEKIVLLILRVLYTKYEYEF